jgi:hypothetical protein
MGDTRTNTFQCSGMFAGSTNSNSGTNEFNAIGYGTLSLPYGDVSNVLLVRLDQSTQYNSSSQGTSQSTSVSYYFVKPGVNYPLLTLLSETDQSSGTVTTLTFVLDQSVLGIRESLAQSIGIDLYPNPAHGSADVVFATPASRQISLEVVDMAGQVVAFNRLGASSSGIHREQIDISALNPGVYHIRITDGNGATGVKKLVVQ